MRHAAIVGHGDLPVEHDVAVERQQLEKASGTAACSRTHIVDRDERRLVLLAFAKVEGLRFVKLAVFTGAARAYRSKADSMSHLIGRQSGRSCRDDR
jgi:hypothetical protein